MLQTALPEVTQTQTQKVGKIPQKLSEEVEGGGQRRLWFGLNGDDPQRNAWWKTN
eukprot:m.35285 g.35285  ORF g.35285 m.35285 type:complete len:55 (-) comp10908_c0_seq2:651-815(-)